MKISVADNNQLALIRNIALATWPVAYKHIISQDQINYMLEMMYSLESLNNQYNQSGHTFFICFDAKEEAVGFAGCSTVYTDNKSLKLHKLYVLPDYQGKGAGKLLLNEVIRFAKTKNAERIELQVNKKNPAVDFYRKNGFAIYRELVLDIGNGYVMDDYLMQISC